MRNQRTARTGLRIGAVVSAIIAAAASPAAAQKDYRALDDGRPVLTQDAYPVERGAFELTLPLSFAQQGSWGVTPELAWGATWNTMVGFKAPVTLRGEAGGDPLLEGVGLFAMHNFNTESPHLPALAIRGDLVVPVRRGDGDPTGTITAIATRSAGAWRTHLNIGRSFGEEVGHSPFHQAGKWKGSLAVDRTLWRRSLLLVADVAAGIPAGDADPEWSSGAGFRWQWTPTWVLDIGARWRFGGGDNIALGIGFAHHFGISSLMKGAVR